jgi:ABC-type branched-subunit amino acid transport system ATPase component
MSVGESAPKVGAPTKRCPGVVASADATLKASAGEAHGASGGNDAGKSTLIKALTGAHWPDSGAIRFDGATCNGVRAEVDWFPTERKSPTGAKRAPKGHPACLKALPGASREE